MAIPERWDSDSRLSAFLLWRATVTPGQCSFASMASTEEGFAAGAVGAYARPLFSST